MFSIAIALLTDNRPKERPVTHSELTHWLPSPEGVELSSCPGEMVASDLLARSGLTPAVVDRSTGVVRGYREVYHCTRC
ncbi:MAG: hypothetical protein IVW52_20665, partial [Acidimicrobiales bacterium]|nr:hypothetical protein [Acidimicrobiales bacterium]